MWTLLLLTLAINLFGILAHHQDNSLTAIVRNYRAIDQAVRVAEAQNQGNDKIAIRSSDEIKAMMHREAANLNADLIDKALAALACVKQQEIAHNNILTIIDYSLPSSEKRLWVFDLGKNKLLFNTYVSHGIKSGAAHSKYFSNKVNSKATSIGVYNTEQAYYGRHGLSLKLHGLDKGFNSNAYNRFIVMHGSWYMDEDFIKKYGRAGRSWGCPAVPKDLIKPIIETIKDKSLLVAYYPGDDWLLKSKNLNCNNFVKPEAEKLLAHAEKSDAYVESRKKIFFADVNNNNKREESEPIIVMRVDDYQRIFAQKVPLKRMLRRQIDSIEYIALSHEELLKMDTNNDNMLNHDDKEGLRAVYFIIPVVKMLRGYYATEMKIVTLGRIKAIQLDQSSAEHSGNYKIHFEGKPSIYLRATDRFIRWLGL